MFGFEAFKKRDEANILIKSAPNRKLHSLLLKYLLLYINTLDIGQYHSVSLKPSKIQLLILTLRVFKSMKIVFAL